MLECQKLLNGYECMKIVFSYLIKSFSNCYKKCFLSYYVLYKYFDLSIYSPSDLTIKQFNFNKFAWFTFKSIDVTNDDDPHETVTKQSDNKIVSGLDL